MDYNSTNEYLKLLNELQAYHIPKNIIDSFSGYLKSIYRSELENHFSAPMLWIGMYIALASLVCILAMVADLVHGFLSGKLWFPCKYFRINSFFLTVISVAMKLPVDLTGSMPGIVDQVAKLGSMAFMCTMMANLLPCLATMDSDDLLSNISALCLLVITLVVNVCIQIQTGVVSKSTYDKDPRITALVSPKRNVTSLPENFTVLPFVYVTLLLVLLIVHVSSSLGIVKSRKIIESKYQQGHFRASEELAQGWLQKYVRSHWIMAGSGNSQFIFTACFQTTSASGVICVFVTALHIITMYWSIEAMLAKDYDSDYSWSMIVIVIVQSIGVVIGTLAPVCRCFATFISFKFMSFKIISRRLKVYQVKSYWTRKLYDWKLIRIRLPFHSYSVMVVIETLKRLILGFCIGFQEGVVVVCNIIALIPFFFMICVLYSCHRLKCLLKATAFSSSGGERTEKFEQNGELRPYVLHLEDEMELAERTLKGLSKSVNRLIEKGGKKQPNNLIRLIKQKSTSCFRGVDLVYQDRWISLHESKEEYQDCWRLAVVTVTTIAVSLPKIEKNEVKTLLESVREGLEYVRLVEEWLNATYDYISIQKEAERLWQEVDVYHKWLGNKLPAAGPSSQMITARRIVEWFRDTANSILCTTANQIKDYNTARGENDDLNCRAICARTMYRITNKILHTHRINSDDKVSQQELFDYLSLMIADIIAACLTNIPQVIRMRCHTSVIEKREDSVKHAALLLGETSGITETLLQHRCPCMNPGELPFIDKWRVCLRNLK